MKSVVVCLEHRFFIFNGELYTKLAFPYAYWKEYLVYFNLVKVVARATPVVELESEMVKVSGPSVEFVPLPYYIGPVQFLSKLPLLLLVSFRIALLNKYFLLRSGNVSSLMWIFLVLLRRPYLREYPGNVKEGVVGFAGGKLKYRILAGFLHWFAKFQGRFSRANSFVSDYCQKLYESSKPGYVFSSFRASEVETFKTQFCLDSNIVKLVSVGRLESEKGHIVLLRAILLLSFSSRVKLHLIGDGSRRPELESFAARHGLDVTFHGALTDRDRLFSILASSDLFVIPSLTEGMPRALLEAMTIGIPSLGSRVGGIPEVLPPECMYEPNSPTDLAVVIDRFLGSELLRSKVSKRNRDFIFAKFDDTSLQTQKVAFWSNLYV